MVAAATYTENLTIAFSLTIAGSGAPRTIIDGGGVNRVVMISTAKAHVTLSRVTIRNGHASSGAGILNSGTLRVVASTVSGNTASTFCNRLCIASGGGINNTGTLTISKSTVSDNVASVTCTKLCSAIGGGIINWGSLTVSNSTLNGNEARSYGGIINVGTVSFNNSTIAGNVAGSGGAIGNANNGGTAALQDSIVANNTGRNCDGTMTSNGYNLSSDNSCNFNNTGDLNNTDPKLGILGNHGGPTQTISLLHGSPAIDAGNPSGCTNGHGHLLKTDQRGKPRPDKEDSGGCDIGAYERQKD
jgi:hypothetical protein